MYFTRILHPYDLSPALVLPAAYFLALGSSESEVCLSQPGTLSDGRSFIDEYGLNVISRGTSIILLVVYVIYLIFQVISAPPLLTSKTIDVSFTA
jgi:Ca2+:H+ antiporter